MARSVLIRENLRYDSRLAVIHETEGWLAIADLHYGYEISHRAAGALFPAWGMRNIEERLEALLADYQPRTVLFLGDLVHTAAASAQFLIWVTDLSDRIPELILLRGNHDRYLRGIDLHDHWRIGSHVFHHGHRTLKTQSGEIVFSGHLHPAKTISDGAGVAQKIPILRPTGDGYILPAFSPWSTRAG